MEEVLVLLELVSRHPRRPGNQVREGVDARRHASSEVREIANAGRAMQQHATPESPEIGAEVRQRCSGPLFRVEESQRKAGPHHRERLGLHERLGVDGKRPAGRRNDARRSMGAARGEPAFDAKPENQQRVRGFETGELQVPHGASGKVDRHVNAGS
jgi:hypothetical protein